MKDLYGASKNSEVPDDDGGHKTSQVLDICNHIIDRCWNDLFLDVKEENEKSLDDLEKVLKLTYTSWSLALETIQNNVDAARRVEDMLINLEDDDDDDYDDN